MSRPRAFFKFVSESPGLELSIWWLCCGQTFVVAVNFGEKVHVKLLTSLKLWIEEMVYVGLSIRKDLVFGSCEVFIFVDFKFFLLFSLCSWKLSFRGSRQLSMSKVARSMFAALLSKRSDPCFVQASGLMGGTGKTCG